VVHFVVHEREGFEERVEDAVDECGVAGCESDTGVEENELEGAPEGFDSDVAGCKVRLVDFRLCFEIGVAGEFPETVRAAEEDVCGRCLGEEEKEGDENRSVHPEHFPHRPAPVLGCHAETRDDRAEGGAACCGEGPEREHVGEFDERVHVLQGRPAGG